MTHLTTHTKKLLVNQLLALSKNMMRHDAIHPGAQGSPCRVAGDGHQQHAAVELIGQDSATSHEILPCERNRVGNFDISSAGKEAGGNWIGSMAAATDTKIS